MTIKQYCIAIHNLLSRLNENTWADFFSTIIENFEMKEIRTIVREINVIYGGAGSFNDLVLYKNGEPAFEENETLENLRKGMYAEIKKIMIA